MIADEAHQLVANVAEYKGQPKAERDNAVMTELSKVPASVARWCLSGTPLKNFKTIGAMDRIFNFLGTGFRTTALSNLAFVDVFGRIAVRFTKNGTFQVCFVLSDAALQRGH